MQTCHPSSDFLPSDLPLSSPFTIEAVEPHIWRIRDAMGFLAHVLVGEKNMALIDTMVGMGDLPSNLEQLEAGLLQESEVRETNGKRGLLVFLTHRHPDHVGGAFAFDEVWMPQEEDGHWQESRSQVAEHRAALAGDDNPQLAALARLPWTCDDPHTPQVHHVAEGDSFDLGGLTLECVALPGHTMGSMGYLCPELGVLFSGDAVTPIMCLCFEESGTPEVWRETLRKMETLPFVRFYTGHHAHAFTKADLPSFEQAALFAEKDRGFAWHHSAVAGWQGTCHLCPCPTQDVDSPDFRAVITKGLPPRKHRSLS